MHLKKCENPLFIVMNLFFICLNFSVYLVISQKQMEETVIVLLTKKNHLLFGKKQQKSLDRFAKKCKRFV